MPSTDPAGIEKRTKLYETGFLFPIWAVIGCYRQSVCQAEEEFLCLDTVMIVEKYMGDKRVLA